MNSPYDDLGVYTRVDPALLAEHNRGIRRAASSRRVDRGPMPGPRVPCPVCGGAFKSLPGHRARSGCGS